jgi:predicted PhzF superfamily epimerase YddE/YHI9
MTRWFAEVPEKRFVVAQGAGVGRDGRVHVHAIRRDGTIRVSISGAAVDVGELPVSPDLLGDEGQG